MTETEFNNILTNDIKKVEHNLLSFLPDCKDGQESVVQAMEYSLINGGGGGAVKGCAPYLRLNLPMPAAAVRKMHCRLPAQWNIFILTV